MKIAIFTDTYLPQVNGVTNTLNRMEKYFNKNQIEYKILAPDYNMKEKPVNVETFYSIRFILYPECRLSMVRSSRVNEVLDEFKPDLVHMTTEFNMGWAGMTYALKREIPSISTYTTNFSHYLKYYKLEMLSKASWDYFRWFHNQNQLTLCPSENTKKLLIGKGVEHVGVWGRGIDSFRFSPSKRSASLRKKFNIADEHIMLLYVGRISLEKDLDILLEVYRRIRREQGDQVRLVITGDGPMLNKYRSENKDVVFTGYLQGEKLSQLYASADIFTFPSSSETLGNVVLEAMASEVPVAGVNSGGVTENIMDHHNGILCKPRNVKAYYQSLKKLIEDRAFRKELGKNARQYALKKDWENVFKKLVDDYLDVIKKRKQIAA